MKKAIISLAFFMITTLCNAQVTSVMVDTNNFMVWPTNGFASINLNGVSITSWQSPTSGMSQVVADQIYVRKDGTNGTMTGILTNTAGFSGNLFGNLIGGSLGNSTGVLTGTLIGNVTNSSLVKIENYTHGILINTNGISLW